MKFLFGLSLLTVVLLFLLGACGVEQPSDALFALHTEGILLPHDPEAPVGVSHDLYTVHRGTLVQELNLAADTYFPVQSHLRFEKGDGYYSGALVEAGQRVQAGDVLARLSFESEWLEIERLQLLLDIEGLKIRNAHENDLRHLEQQLEEIEGMLVGFELLAPHDGIVSFMNTASPGFLSGRPLIATVIDDRIMFFTVVASPLYVRFGGEFPMEATGGYNASFTARVVSDPLASGGGYAQAEFLLEPCAGFTPGLRPNTQFRAKPYFVLAYDALLINRRAVVSEGLRHFVYVYEQGYLRKRYITLGASAGMEVEVLSGLTEGQRVVLQW
jgi:hypothetical protein